jgi:hypothetical protein
VHGMILKKKKNIAIKKTSRRSLVGGCHYHHFFHQINQNQSLMRYVFL